MKAGFWVAPEGEDSAMSIMPIDTEVPVAARKLSFLATATAEEMIQRCRDTAALLPKIADALDRQLRRGRRRGDDAIDRGGPGRQERRQAAVAQRRLGRRLGAGSRVRLRRRSARRQDGDEQQRERQTDRCTTCGRAGPGGPTRPHDRGTTANGRAPCDAARG